MTELEKYKPGNKFTINELGNDGFELVSTAEAIAIAETIKVKLFTPQFNEFFKINPGNLQFGDGCLAAYFLQNNEAFIFDIEYSINRAYRIIEINDGEMLSHLIGGEASGRIIAVDGNLNIYEKKFHKTGDQPCS